jgi:uroporphyrin-III C-methyltransferase
VYAGRAPGEPGTGRQDEIHQQLIDHARAGRTVVRLKGGDPFVFGRGGEEVQALAEAGVPCEVGPGISAAIAAPGAALVPVTHRRVSAAFGVFTGHDADGHASANVDWALAAAIPTAVIMMGVHHLDEIVTRLIEHGRAPETPAMIVERATWPDQRVIVAPLDELPDQARGVTAPATLVIGEVVRMSQQSNGVGEAQRISAGAG